MQADDRTGEIALHFEARVYLHEIEGFFESARGYVEEARDARFTPLARSLLKPSINSRDSTYGLPD